MFSISRGLVLHKTIKIANKQLVKQAADSLFNLNKWLKTIKNHQFFLQNPVFDLSSVIVV